MDDFTRIFTDDRAWIDIPAPMRPVEPTYETEDLPDKDHTWHSDDPTCAACGRSYGWEKATPPDCLRLAAHSANERKRQDYERRVRTYTAQMEYYNSVIVPLQQ